MMSCEWSQVQSLNGIFSLLFLSLSPSFSLFLIDSSVVRVPYMTFDLLWLTHMVLMTSLRVRGNSISVLLIIVGHFAYSGIHINYT